MLPALYSWQDTPTDTDTDTDTASHTDTDRPDSVAAQRQPKNTNSSVSVSSCNQHVLLKQACNLRPTSNQHGSRHSRHSRHRRRSISRLEDLIKEGLTIMAVSIVDCFPGLLGVGRGLRAAQEVPPLLHLPLQARNPSSVTTAEMKTANANF